MRWDGRLRESESQRGTIKFMILQCFNSSLSRLTVCVLLCSTRWTGARYSPEETHQTYQQYLQEARAEHWFTAGEIYLIIFNYNISTGDVITPTYEHSTFLVSWELSIRTKNLSLSGQGWQCTVYTANVKLNWIDLGKYGCYRSGFGVKFWKIFY